MSSASIIKIKRSQVTGNPPILAAGELAYSALTNNDANGGDRLYIGIGTETNGNAANHYVIGGKYFTDLLDHTRGVLTADSAIITDSANKINEINIDNIKIDENTISSTNSNGNIILNPNGNGNLEFTGSSSGALFKITNGTDTRFQLNTTKGTIEQSTPSLVTSDTVLNITSAWNNSDADFYGIKLDVTDHNSSANSRLIDLRKSGTTKFNVDIDGNVFIGGQIDIGGEISISDLIIAENDTNSFRVLTKELDSTSTLVETEYLHINTVSDIFTIKTADVVIDNDLEISGDLTVKGNVTSFQTITLEVEDPLVKFGSGNNADLFSIGFYGEYTKDSVKHKTGLFRSHIDKKYYLFDDLTGNITSTNVVDSDGFDLSDLVLNNISASQITATTFIGSLTGNATNVTGTVAVANGGTGQTTYTNGELLIGNTTGNTLTKATLTQGDRITITNGAGSISIAAAATNIAQGTRTTTTVPITSSTGTSATLDIATSDLAGVMSSADKTKLDGIATGANNYSLPTATSTVLGGVKLGSDTTQSIDANSVSATESRSYAIQMNASNQLLVNIPWTDTTYTAGNGIDLSGTTFSVSNGTGLAQDATGLSLAANYGDTLNPYASKTAKFFLAAPNADAGVPTFREIVASDIPTLNQNTTGSAATLTTSRNIWGQSFNGSDNVSGNITGAGTIEMGTQTNKATLTYTTNTTRTYTIPDAGANADFVMNAGNQDIGGVKTFTGAITITGTSNAAGRFYAGTTDPSNTTRLNYDGNFHANLFVGSIDGGTY